MSRIIYAPTNLQKYLEKHNDIELILGSSFFLIKHSNDDIIQVWLTPKRCHFKIRSIDISSSANEVINNHLPIFKNLFHSNAVKISTSDKWEWLDLQSDIDFICHTDHTEDQLNTFFIQGNNIALAGPYIFWQDPYGESLFGFLKNCSVEFVEEILSINFASNNKPWLNPTNFSNYILNSIDEKISSRSKTGNAVHNEIQNIRIRIKNKPKLVKEQIGKKLKADESLCSYGEIYIDGERFQIKAKGGYIMEGELIEIVDTEGVWLVASKID